MAFALVAGLYLLVAICIASMVLSIYDRKTNRKAQRREMLSHHNYEFLEEANKAEFNDWLNNGKSFSYISQEIVLAKVIAERDIYKQMCERVLRKEQTR